MLPSSTILATARAQPTGAAAWHHGYVQFLTRTPQTEFLPYLLFTTCAALEQTAIEHRKTAPTSKETSERATVIETA
jgi:hypothetical protein